MVEKSEEYFKELLVQYRSDVQCKLREMEIIAELAKSFTSYEQVELLESLLDLLEEE